MGLLVRHRIHGDVGDPVAEVGDEQANPERENVSVLPDRRVSRRYCHEETPGRARKTSLVPAVDPSHLDAPRAASEPGAMPHTSPARSEPTASDGRSSPCGRLNCLRGVSGRARPREVPELSPAVSRYLPDADTG
jgi:hypothetical protein